FVAGSLSGITKLIVGHPFDTIKLRIQCTKPGFYSGPIDCLKRTIQNEGFRALYKGASPPALGWAISDSILMGSLDKYRNFLFRTFQADHQSEKYRPEMLEIKYHALAGVMAGWTVCLVVTPIETVKAKLQMQTSDPRTKFFTGPIDCSRKMIAQAGLLRSFYKALPSTILFRTSFGAMFSSYQVLINLFNRSSSTSNNSRGKNDKNMEKKNLFKGVARLDDQDGKYKKLFYQFLAGGISAELFWLIGFPFDSIKNRMMSDSIYEPKYKNVYSTARSIWLEGGLLAFYRGFIPCALRAFPTNAAALFVW
ncbi:mitochondrial carrier domain-containing protein, partial [Phakopsora pachyrhizi]